MAFWNGKATKISVSLIAALGSVVAAAFFVDDRYAHAADVKAMHAEQLQAIRETKDETQRAAAMLRKQNLEDRIFEINLVPEGKRTTVQRALLDRYTREVQEINGRLTNRSSSSQGN